MNHVLSLVRGAPLLVGLAFLTGSVTGQTCGVRNSYRIANSHSGVGSELNVITGWQTTAPLATPGFNNHPGPTCSSQGSCNPISDYGYLHCDGTGAANNCPSGGVFLWLDQGPQARFMDTLAVVSSTLPIGTPVQLRAVVTLSGFAHAVDPSPVVNFSAGLSASSLALTVANGPGTTSGLISTTVGATMTVTGELGISIYLYGLMGLGIPPVFGSYDFDLTARMGITCLTPGASLSFCSGRTYGGLAADVRSVGGGCGAGSPVLTAAPPILGQTQSYNLTSSIASQPVFLAYSLGHAVGVPVGPCTLMVDQTAMALFLAGTTDGAGACAFGLGIPSSPGLAGGTVMAQALVLSPGGPMLGLGQLSNGLEMTLGF
jgi:hypothetical protein